MPYVHADGAEAFALGPVAGGSLAITAGRGALFAAASPSAGSPLPLAVFRGPDGLEELIGAVLVTGVSGDSLTIAGAVPGYANPTVQAGDVVASVPLAYDAAALWAAVGSCVTTSDLATALGPYALTSALSAYATATALSDGLATKQATLTAGSVSTTLLADSGVTTVKVGNKQITYAKLQDAGGAGVLGSPGAGAHQLLTLGAGLSIVGGALTVTAGGSGTVTSVAVASANGLGGTVSNATTAASITLTCSITGVLKGTGTAIAQAVAGTDYVSPAGLTSALASYVALTGAQTLYDKSTQASGGGDQLKFLNTLGVQASGVDADGNEGAYDLSFLLAAGVDLIAGASASQTARWPGKISEILIKANVNGASGGFTLKLLKGATTIATQAVVASNTSLVTIAAGSISDLAIAKGDVISATCETSPGPGTGVQSVEVYIKHSRRNR